MNIHAGKTNVIRVHTSSVEPIRLGQKVLDDVDSFAYLVSIIDTKGE